MLAGLCLSAFGYTLLDPRWLDDIAVRIEGSGVFWKLDMGGNDVRDLANISYLSVWQQRTECSASLFKIASQLKMWSVGAGRVLDAWAVIPV